MDIDPSYTFASETLLVIPDSSSGATYTLSIDGTFTIDAMLADLALNTWIEIVSTNTTAMTLVSGSVSSTSSTCSFVSASASTVRALLTAAPTTHLQYATTTCQFRNLRLLYVGTSAWATTSSPFVLNSAILALRVQSRGTMLFGASTTTLSLTNSGVTTPCSYISGIDRRVNRASLTATRMVTSTLRMFIYPIVDASAMATTFTLTVAASCNSVTATHGSPSGINKYDSSVNAPYRVLYFDFTKTFPLDEADDHLIDPTCYTVTMTSMGTARRLTEVLRTITSATSMHDFAIYPVGVKISSLATPSMATNDVLLSTDWEMLIWRLQNSNLNANLTVTCDILGAYFTSDAQRVPSATSGVTELACTGSTVVDGNLVLYGCPKYTLPTDGHLETFVARFSDVILTYATFNAILGTNTMVARTFGLTNKANNVVITQQNTDASDDTLVIADSKTGFLVRGYSRGAKSFSSTNSQSASPTVTHQVNMAYSIRLFFFRRVTNYYISVSTNYHVSPVSATVPVDSCATKGALVFNCTSSTTSVSEVRPVYSIDWAVTTFAASGWTFTSNFTYIKAGLIVETSNAAVGGPMYDTVISEPQFSFNPVFTEETWTEYNFAATFSIFIMMYQSTLQGDWAVALTSSTCGTLLGNPAVELVNAPTTPASCATRYDATGYTNVSMGAVCTFTPPAFYVMRLKYAYTLNNVDQTAYFSSKQVPSTCFTMTRASTATIYGPVTYAILPKVPNNYYTFTSSSFTMTPGPSPATTVTATVTGNFTFYFGEYIMQGTQFSLYSTYGANVIDFSNATVTGSLPACALVSASSTLLKLSLLSSTVYSPTNTVKFSCIITGIIVGNSSAAAAVSSSDAYTLVPNAITILSAAHPAAGMPSQDMSIALRAADTPRYYWFIMPVGTRYVNRGSAAASVNYLYRQMYVYFYSPYGYDEIISFNVVYSASSPCNGLTPIVSFGTVSMTLGSRIGYYTNLPLVFDLTTTSLYTLPTSCLTFTTTVSSVTYPIPYCGAPARSMNSYTRQYDFVIYPVGASFDTSTVDPYAVPGDSATVLMTWDLVLFYHNTAVVNHSIPLVMQSTLASFTTLTGATIALPLYSSTYSKLSCNDIAATANTVTLSNCATVTGTTDGYFAPVTLRNRRPDGQERHHVFYDDQGVYVVQCAGRACGSYVSGLHHILVPLLYPDLPPGAV